MLIHRSLCPRAGAFAALALAALPLVYAQQPEPAITFLKDGRIEAEARPRPSASRLAENYREFPSARVGESSEPEVFTLQFHATTRVTGISAANDFRVSGGTCIEGHTYSPGDVCSVEVTFTPQGPGHRTGRLEVTHTAAALPLLAPTGGDAYGPAVAFIPAEITTVSETYPGNKGLLLKPQGLAVDGGDNLYIADTGNNLIRYRDSGGAVTVFAGGGTVTSPTFEGLPTKLKLAHPYGVAVDAVGISYFTDTGNNVVHDAILDALTTTAIGGATPTTPPTCTEAAPCGGTDVALTKPAGIALDPLGNVVFTEVDPGLGETAVADGSFDGNPSGLWYPGSEALESVTTTYPIAIDANDTLYTTGDFGGGTVGSEQIGPLCAIYAQRTATNDEELPFWIVAGTAHCGFSGDGGLATGAEISSNVQGLTFDSAGDFFFTDTGNQRVRRIDGLTGVIHTVAGDGTAGYKGDDGPATAAELNLPTGVAVDSRGIVYVTGLSDTAGHAVVRQIGPAGALTFANQAESSASVVKTVTVTNVGNEPLAFSSFTITAGDTADFAVAPSVTTCSLTEPLGAGQSCLIGVIFTPSAAGARSATLTAADNTVTGSNVILLNGTGVKPAVAKLAPAALDFSLQKVKTESEAQTVHLENTGDLPLRIESWGFAGADARDFTETHTCGATLEAGARCTIDVRFKPSAAGIRSATLMVKTAAKTAELELKGTSK
jgi:hypothetical protein